MPFKCLFCKQHGQTVKAHIIPKAFFRAITTNDTTLKQREIGLHPKKMRIGVYDQELWCKTCEDRFSYLDDYAIGVLSTPLADFECLPVALELKIQKPLVLKQFFISLLWRASNSRQRLFEAVSIGEKHAQIAIDILNGHLDLLPTHFATVLSYTGEDAEVITNPVPVRHHGINFYRFHLGRFSADIKVDSRAIPSPLEFASLGHSNTLGILKVPRRTDIPDLAKVVAQQISK